MGGCPGGAGEQGREIYIVQGQEAMICAVILDQGSEGERCRGRRGTRQGGVGERRDGLWTKGLAGKYQMCGSVQRGK